MSGTIFLAGILQFDSRARFEEALEALRTEETYSEQASLVPVFEEAMISDTVLLLRHHAAQGPTFYDRLMAEAYLLSEFAGRGYIAGILRDARVRVQVAMAAMTHPVIDEFKVQPDPDAATDYLPRMAGATLHYRYRSEGREEQVAWQVQPSRHGHHNYICFPHEGSEDPFNDWWDGHYFLKSGQRWYTMATDPDPQALHDPAPEEIQLILDGAAQPGSIYLSYVPGTENFRMYTHEGYEDVEVPMGTYLRCLKMRVDLYFLPTEESRYLAEETERAFKKVTTTHYFGKGAGLVRLVFEDGDLCLTAIEQGKVTEQPATQAAATQQRPAQATAPDERRAKGRKPWWKFW